MTININNGKMTMYYYLIPMAILFAVAIFGNPHAASPFASQQVKDICAHMTKAERTMSAMRVTLYMLCLGVVPGAIGLIIGPLFFKSALTGVTVCYGLVLVVTLILLKWCPYITKWQQSLLASTEWAKNEGIEADDIKLFRWQQK